MEPIAPGAARDGPRRSGSVHWAGPCTDREGTATGPPWNGGQDGSRTPLSCNSRILTESEDPGRPCRESGIDLVGFGNPPCFGMACPYHQGVLHVSAMNLGEVYLESLSTGIITQQEIDWITIQQAVFNREEEAMALRIGRLLDEGTLQIGCRLFEQPSMQLQPVPPLG